MATPSFFTVEEAAQILRIGRTAAYMAAKRHRVSKGVEGLPVVMIGGSLRVPRVALERLAGGPVQLDDRVVPVTSLDARRSNKTVTPSGTERTTKPKGNSRGSQTSLPFTG